MLHTLSRIVPLLLAPALAPGLAAQQAAPSPSPTELRGLRTPIHTAADDDGQAYGTWAAGADYKVAFDDGCTFVPYLGADYPHNQPLRWRTTSVRLGERELLAPRAAPARRLEDFRCSFDHGACVEVYDVRLEGVEQSFVFATLPATGDLVLTGAIASALRADDRSPRHGDVVFRDDEGRAITRYGAAYAVDARGDRLELATGVAAGRITLHVPAAWLATAALPVVVDPVLTTAQLNTIGNDFGDVDIDAAPPQISSPDEFLFTFTRAASATDSDIYAARFDAAFANPSTVFADITSSWDTDQAACGNTLTGFNHYWVVVLRRYFVNNPVRTSGIRLHSRFAGSTVYSTAVAPVVSATGGNLWRPAISTGWSSAMIAFQREDNAGTGGHFADTSASTVHAISYNPALATFGTSFLVHGPSGSDSEQPSLSRQVGDVLSPFQQWMCAVQTRDVRVLNDDWDVVVRRLDLSGQVDAAMWTSDIGVSGADHQLHAVIDGLDGRCAVLFATTPVNGTGLSTSPIAGRKLVVERFDWHSADPAPDPAADRPPVVLRSSNNRVFEATDITIDSGTRSHWELGYRIVSPAQPAVCYARVGYQGEPTEGPLGTVLYSVAGETPTAVACCSSWPVSIFAHCVNSGLHPLFLHEVGFNPAPPTAKTGFGCAAANISWEGSQQIGAALSDVMVTSSTPVGMFLLASLASADLPMTSPGIGAGCRLLVQTGPGFLAAMPYQFGTTGRWNMPLPEWLPPLTLYFQGWVYDASILESTQRLEVPIVK